MAQPADRPVAALDLAVFVAELALLAALAVAVAGGIVFGVAAGALFAVGELHTPRAG